MKAIHRDFKPTGIKLGNVLKVSKLNHKLSRKGCLTWVNVKSFYFNMNA